MSFSLSFVALTFVLMLLGAVAFQSRQMQTAPVRSKASRKTRAKA